jgi:multidrug efflux system membrane fusion protein
MSSAFPRRPPSGHARSALGLFLLAALLMTGCSQPPAPKDKSIEVIVTTPITDSVVEYEDFTGRMDAFRTVDIRARVTGYVDEAPFVEGQRVRKDDVLFRIDPRIYQAQYDQAVADLGNRKAMATKMESLYRRTIELVRTKASSLEDVENQKGDWEVARAAITQAEARVRETKQNLDFCAVTAPMSGRISRRYVDPGNLVKADDTMLTTLVADDTVYAYFDVDERTYLDLVGESMAVKPMHMDFPTAATAWMIGANLTDASRAVGAVATVAVRLKSRKIPVLMRLANAEEFTHVGYIDFLDNRLNGNTGTIRMRGVFANPRDTLKAGLFVRVRLPVGRPHKALLIPDEALQSDQGRKYVYVVKNARKDDGTADGEVVEYRLVSIGQAVKGLREIKDARRDADGKIIEGLEAGERVVISGMQRVRPKMHVHATVQPPPKPPGSQLEKLLNQAEAGELTGTR